MIEKEAKQRLASQSNSAFIQVSQRSTKEQKMTTKQIIEAKVIDTNNHLRGWMDVEVEFHKNLPVVVIHDGKTYNYTGKDGVWMSRGRETREMATTDDARLWVTLDGTQVLED
jgi:hypothetical protein